MRKFQKIKYLFVMLIALIVFVLSGNVVNAEEYDSGPEKIIYDFIGHYSLNYTGNTNHYDYWNATGTNKLVSRNYKDRTDVSGINNSSAIIGQTDSNSLIKKAILVWQSRAEDASTARIGLITPNGTRKPIVADWVCQDTRTNGAGEEYVGVYTMAADVTELVCSSSGGYGTYTVANIPVWDGVQEGETVCGGESVASWQLVIVEESPNFPLRTISLNILSQYFFNINYTVNVNFADASAPTGDISLQWYNLFTDVDSQYRLSGSINWDPAYWHDESNYRYKTPTRGLYKNGISFNNRDTGNVYGTGSGANGAVHGHLYEETRPVNNLNSTGIIYLQEGTSRGMCAATLGVSIDVFAYDIVFDGNGADAGSMENLTCIYGRGYNLSENQYTKQYWKFTGWNTKPDGSGISYRKGQFVRNLTATEDKITLYAQWEPNAYKITLDNQHAGVAGTKQYYEWYGVGNYTTDECISEISKITVPQKKGFDFGGYYTEKNGHGTKYVDSTGKILSKSTTFDSDTTLYAYWTSGVYKITLDNQEADTAGTKEYYEKFGVGNYTTADCTTEITRIDLPTKKHHEFAGYYTEKNGDGQQIIDEEGNIVDSYTLFDEDTTIYANWEPNTYKITLDNQSATNMGSPAYYEKYGVANYVEMITAIYEWENIFDYTGSVQTFIAPYDGVYTLDLYGAKGYNNDKGGYGGRAEGQIILEKGDELYIYVGGAGADTGRAFNGGGAPYIYSDSEFPYGYVIYGGGGATDIRKSGKDLSNRIIVAGGGGGSGHVYDDGEVLDNSAYGGDNSAGIGGTSQVWRDFPGYTWNAISTSGNITGMYTASDIRKNMIVDNNNIKSMSEGQIFKYNGNNSYECQIKMISNPTLGYSDIGGGGGYYGGGCTIIRLSGNTVSTFLLGIGGSAGSSYVGGVENGIMYAIDATGQYMLGDIGCIDTNGNSIVASDGHGKAIISYKSYDTEIIMANSITIPQKVGYTFGGYYTEKNGHGTQYVDESGNILSMPTTFEEDTTLYAYWIADTSNTYKIQFHGNGATSGAMPILTCNFDQIYPLTLNAFERVGYKFTGWSTTADGEVIYEDGASVKNLAASSGEVVTLYAQWEAANTSFMVKHYTENLQGRYELHSTDNKSGKTGSKVDAVTLKKEITGFTYDHAMVKGVVATEVTISADSSLVISLYYTRNSYELTLKKDNGISSVSGAGTYKCGETVYIDAEVKDSYTWYGWSGAYATTEKQYEFIMPAEDITLQANTSPMIFTIYLENQQATTPGTLQYYEKYDVGNYEDEGCSKSITKIELPEKRGYIFGGYYTGENGQGLQYVKADGTITSTPTTFTDDIVLHAKWTPIIYRIHFDGNGATGGSMNDMICSYGQPDKLSLNKFQRTKYSFVGWNTKADGSGFSYIDGADFENLSETQDDVITLYAQWTSNDYIIRFDGNGADGGTMEDMVCEFDVSYPLNKNRFTRTGYEFTGWGLAPDNEVEYTDEAVVKNVSTMKGYVTLYAQWTPEVYKITLDNQEADSSGTKAYYEKYDTGNYADASCSTRIDVISLPQKTGYVFGGYYTEENGHGLQYIEPDGTIISTTTTFLVDTTLYAYWTPITYIIRFEGNGSTGGSMNDLICTYGQEYPLPLNQFTKDLYRFDYWNTEADASGLTSYIDGAVIKNLSSTQNAVITLYAIWTPDTYFVSFDANGGEGAMEDVMLYFNVSQQLPQNLFTKSNEYGPSTFLGWNIDAAATAALYEDETGVMNIPGSENGHVTLYAIWDHCPWIIAEDLYYSLYEAQNGLITYDELMCQAIASDLEDGSPLLPGIDAEKGTSFTIIDYLPTDFTQFTASGSVTETYQVIDSAGNVYKKMITVHVVDTTATEMLPEGTTRFINEKYYNETYENGGLEDTSVWKTDLEFVAVIQKAFENSRNDTPIMSFSFTYEEIQKMKEFIRVNGIGNTGSGDALQRFYDEFLIPNMVN